MTKLQSMSGSALLGGGPTKKYLTRKEWAKERRTPYYDRFPSPSDRLAEYATPEEITALKIALSERWKQLGQKLREIPKAEPDSRQERVRKFATGDYSERERIQHRRSSINAALKLIEEGEIPLCLEEIDGAQDILASLHAKYEAAKAELHEHTLREIERTPIDDEAWEDELKRREYVEECLANMPKAAFRR